MDRGPNKPKPKRGSAFEKLQSERETKGVEEDLERNEEEREERERTRGDLTVVFPRRGPLVRRAKEVREEYGAVRGRGGDR